MKLNKMKIARLTEKQAKLIKGGAELIDEAASTVRKFTCGWCTSDDSTFDESCNTKNNGQNTCYHCPTM